MSRPSRVCSVLDCGRVHKAHGLCARCLRKAQRKSANVTLPGPDKASRGDSQRESA